MKIEKIKKANTKEIGKKIEYFEQIDSTHKYAKKIAFENEEKGKIIIADMQTAGIGTKGRKWYSGKAKNIAMSIILKPKIKIKQLEGFTIKIASCMKKSIYELYNIDLDIKEPNDLLLSNKKICGILTETSTIGEKINYLIISIGFNVNEDNFSTEIKDIATSLKSEFKRDFTREEIIIKFIENLEKELEFFA